MNKLFLRKKLCYILHIYIRINITTLYSTCFSRVVLTNVEM